MPLSATISYTPDFPVKLAKEGRTEEDVWEENLKKIEDNFAKISETGRPTYGQTKPPIELRVRN